MKKWIKAFRLRTLPLALACVSMGSFLAAADDVFRLDVFLLTLLTTLFLQILSNLSNDYGDYIHGADHHGRTGPSRAVSSGEITPDQMKRMIAIFILMAFFCGIGLLLISIAIDFKFLMFLLMGVAAIAAAIYYTMGKKPYGYVGLGDISVFLFFGWLGVIGSYYLHAQSFDATLLLPASTCSFFAVAVLNVNNIRDIESDRNAGKKSIPVRIGRENALVYHYSLLILGLLSSIIYVIIKYEGPFQFLFLAVIPLLVKNGSAIKKLREARLLDPYLKQMALTTLIFVILFGVGQLIY